MLVGRRYKIATFNGRGMGHCQNQTYGENTEMIVMESVGG